MGPRRAAPVTAILIALALAGGAVACGDDEPSITIPATTGATGADEATTSTTSTTSTTTTAAETTGATTTGGSGTGGAPSADEGPDDSSGEGSGSGEGDEGSAGGGWGGVDSPENDLPPEPGSPEEAFEQDCAENPESCG